MATRKVHLQLDEGLIAQVRALAKMEDRTFSGMFSWLVKQGMISRGLEPSAAPATVAAPATITLQPVTANETDPTLEPPDPHDWYKPR